MKNIPIIYVNNLCVMGNFANSTLQNRKIISIFAPKIWYK